MLQRIANGDDTAARELVDAFAPMVWRLAHRYLDKASSEIEDAVQDVFVEVWLNAKRYDGRKGSEAAFVATIAHRRLIDAQRRAVARHKHERAKSASSIENQPVGPIKQSVRNQVFEHVADKFDELPDDERQVIWLFIHRGLTHRQIGDALGTPIGTVKTRLRRGVMRLGKLMRGAERSHVQTEGGNA